MKPATILGPYGVQCDFNQGELLATVEIAKLSPIRPRTQPSIPDWADLGYSLFSLHNRRLRAVENRLAERRFISVHYMHPGSDVPERQ